VSATARRWARIQRLSLERAPRPRSRWPWFVALAFGLGVLAGTQLHAGAPDAVTLIVRPLVMIQRGDIRIEARVPRHSANRLLAIAWTSDVGTLGSTIRQLDGEDAEVLHTLNLPSQPPSNYTFTATVVGADGKPRGRTEARIHVPDDGDR
jgi:hypothetical protein